MKRIILATLATATILATSANASDINTPRTPEENAQAIEQAEKIVNSDSIKDLKMQLEKKKKANPSGDKSTQPPIPNSNDGSEKK